MRGRQIKGMTLTIKRYACLTFSILQQKENCVFGDEKIPQLHHVGHRVRHDSLLSPPTVTALSQTLQWNERGEGHG